MADGVWDEMLADAAVSRRKERRKLLPLCSGREFIETLREPLRTLGDSRGQRQQKVEAARSVRESRKGR